jgi:rubrerythrin
MPFETNSVFETERRRSIMGCKRAILPALSSVVIATAIALAGPVTAQRSPAPPAPAADSLIPVEVRDTRGNLQEAFGTEVNTKARYQAAATIADQEGYRSVASLFRACAVAEQVHADQHVHAIAWSGDAAKAFLERLALSSTAENLRVAVDLENYEATRRYPALMEKARAEHMTAAVRSMNFALAAEREHARLFTAALASLEQRPEPRTLHVCPSCGWTTATLDFRKCPTCFTSAKKFIAVR